MSSYDDFLNDSEGSDDIVTGSVTLDEILYFGQQADWGWSRTKYLGLFKLTDNTVLLAAAEPGISLADQDLEVLGTVVSDYSPEFLTNTWIAMAGWRIGSGGHDSAEGFRIIFSNGDRNGYGDKYWLQTFEFYGDNFHEDSRAISAPDPLNSKNLGLLEDLHEFDINGDGSIGQTHLGGSTDTPGTPEDLTPGTPDSTLLAPNSGSSDPPNFNLEGLLDQVGGELAGSGQNININIVNNTNTGSGNITTGDINQGNTYITFTIGTINLDMSEAIFDPSPKNNRIEGTSDDDTIAAGLGKDKLIGGRGEDHFVVGSVDEAAKKKFLDTITDFRPKDDLLVVDDVVHDIDEETEVAIVENKKEFKQATKDAGTELIYNEKKGTLFVDANDGKGLGKDGGPIVKLAGKPDLDPENIVMLSEKSESVSSLFSEPDPSSDPSIQSDLNAEIVPLVDG